MNLYVVLKIIQTITYEWTSDMLYVEADETIWELCAVGRCARVVVNHVRPRDWGRGWRRTMPNSASCEVLIGIPIWGNTCDELLCIDDADGSQILNTMIQFVIYRMVSYQKEGGRK